MSRRAAALFILLCIGLAIPSCGGSGHEIKPRLTELRVAVLPDDSPEALRQRFEPALKLVAEELGVPYRLIIPEDYEHFLELFIAGEVDLAHFGGYSYALASEQAEAVPLVQCDVDARFFSYFVARADDASADIAAFQGKKLSFGSKLSTSGHLMPRSFLIEMGITPERYFGEILFSGSHDTTAYWVRDGKADLGVLNAQVYEALLEDGRLEADALRIVYETPPYPDYLWAVSLSVTEADRLAIRDVFLDFHAENDAHRAFMKRMGAEYFVPVNDESYQPIRAAITAAGLGGH